MKLRNSLLLLLTATIWGVAFVAQSVGMDYVGPFTFVFARNVIGGLVLLPVIAVLGKSGGPHPKQAPEERRKARKTLVIGGMCCGTALCAGSITPAVRAAVYAGRQGRIPHRVLHPDRAAARPAVRPQMRCEALGAALRWQWPGCTSCA